MRGEQRVAMRIKCLNNQIKRLMERTAIAGNDQNLTGMQFAMLGFLADRQDRDVFQRDVEAEFNIRRSTATGLLQSLERQGFIRREEVAEDARLKRIIMSEKALELNKAVRAHMDQMERRLTAGITPEELRGFYQVMDKIGKNADG